MNQYTFLEVVTTNRTIFGGVTNLHFLQTFNLGLRKPFVFVKYTIYFYIPDLEVDGYRLLVFVWA